MMEFEPVYEKILTHLNCRLSPLTESTKTHYLVLKLLILLMSFVTAVFVLILTTVAAVQTLVLTPILESFSAFDRAKKVCFNKLKIWATLEIV